ncbi:hypothetical protein F5Y13DRAFT_185100 [Hypoxylon sp. FL1857]|nr:hypothetical protein F5Y13DRAFT_185100 [Hypoxylon sp. FL1857]
MADSKSHWRSPGRPPENNDQQSRRMYLAKGKSDVLLYIIVIIPLMDLGILRMYFYM